MKKTLGLDLGTNSIGWSLIEEDGKGKPVGLIDCGTRIFIKAVEEKTPTPKNHKRRQARMARRLLQRRARRRRRLENYLISLGLLPAEVRNPEKRESVLNAIGKPENVHASEAQAMADPYALRAKALDERLDPYELGKVLLHLVSRRGFQSNRKTLFSDMLDDPDVQEILSEMEREDGEKSAGEEKEESAFKAAIHDLQLAIEDKGCRTLGEYLNSLPLAERKRNRRTGREMYKYELSEILREQSNHHAVLTEAVKQEIGHIIFFQRPLRISKDTVGFCSLEKKSRRSSMARLEFQRFRYLQDINNLQYDYEQVNPETGEITGLGIKLGPEDRNKLKELLEQQRTVSWAGIKKHLGLPKAVKFNLEATTKTKGIAGNQTACSIRSVLGSRWDSMTPEQQSMLVEDLISFEKKLALKNRLVRHWGLSAREAVQLVACDLPDGYGNLSLKAIRKLLPFLENGMRYDEARIAAGYTYEMKEQEKPADRLPSPPQIRNPIVQKALYEVRRVVNAVIAAYGKPDSIRIELPRELTMSKSQKDSYMKKQKENQKANERADTAYAEVRMANPHLKLGARPSNDDRLRFRLWEEQEYKCLYTGKTISMTELFSSAVDIDHILPYSRTVNDSYLNKAVVMATVNREKGNRTPFEAFSGNTDRWEQIVLRARKLHPQKYKAVMQQELGSVEGFINSQLTDTAYISREVHTYVSCLGSDVSVTKGIITSWLRRQWGLNSLLGSEVKNREDHRHHAIDATVVALTSRRLYMDIVHAAERGRDIHVAEPWPGFRDVLQQRLEKVIVSHAPVRKLVGAFHEETGYGVQEKEGGGHRVVCRKSLDERFDAKQVEKVLDPHLKELLKGHLEKFGNNAKLAFSNENRPCYGKGQAPLRHVRIIAAENFNPDSHLVVRDARGKPYRYHPYGNNHHVEILRHKETGKIRGEFVTTWQAAQRVRRDRSLLFKTDHGPEWEFLMALCISDLVMIGRGNDKTCYRVQSLDPDGGRLVLREHTAATLNNDSQKIRKSINALVNELSMKPVSISPLGHIRYDQKSN